jgi:hypothetical protein
MITFRDRVVQRLHTVTVNTRFILFNEMLTEKVLRNKKYQATKDSAYHLMLTSGICSLKKMAGRFTGTT